MNDISHLMGPPSAVPPTDNRSRIIGHVAYHAGGAMLYGTAVGVGVIFSYLAQIQGSCGDEHSAALIAGARHDVLIIGLVVSLLTLAWALLGWRLKFFWPVWVGLALVTFGAWMYGASTIDSVSPFLCLPGF